MSNIQQIPLTSPDGVTLATQGKYCRCNLQVVPKLLPITVRKNGVYPIPDGHAGHGQVSVNVAGKPEGALSATKNGSYTPPEGTVYSAVEVAVPIKEEITLVVTKNGTYTAPEGKVFTSIVVNIPQTEQGGTVTPPDTNSFTIKVGEEFSIPYEGSSPTVECPGCLDYYIDGGIIVFTGAAVGNGTIYLRDSDTLIGQYTVIVTEANHVHQYTSTVVPPTCVAGGYTVKTCACGDSVTGSFTAAKGHTWGIPYYGDEFSSGYGHKCAVCGELEELSHTHVYTAAVKEPTCTEGGYTTHTCSCGDSYTDSETEAKGHLEGEPQLTNTPTCVVGGHYKVTCSRCGFLIDEYDDDGVFGEHAWCDPIVFAPTCTSAGYTRVVCDTCGTLTDTPGDPALGHDYQLVSDSSQSSGAAMKCTRCGDSYEASYDCDILGHETDDGAYDVDGEEKYKCKHCGEFY